MQKKKIKKYYKNKKKIFKHNAATSLPVECVGQTSPELDYKVRWPVRVYQTFHFLNKASLEQRNLLNISEENRPNKYSLWQDIQEMKHSICSTNPEAPGVLIKCN